MVATWRYSSKTFDHRTRFEKPYSSSMVMKTTPLAVPGRWRQMTMPATLTFVPDWRESTSRDD